MVRSFALTASIITNRIWSVVFVVALLPQLDTTFHGDQGLMVWTIASGASWLGWTIPLLVAEWWLGRTPARPARRRVANTGSPLADDRVSLAADS